MAKPTQRYPSKSISLKPRTAIVVIAAAAAQGIVIADNAVIARRVVVESVDGLLENGVCCDLLTAGVVEVIAGRTPSDEHLRLNAGMARKIVGLVGLGRCIELGVYDE